MTIWWYHFDNYVKYLLKIKYSINGGAGVLLLAQFGVGWCNFWIVLKRFYRALFSTVHQLWHPKSSRSCCLYQYSTNSPSHLNSDSCQTLLYAPQQWQINQNTWKHRCPIYFEPMEIRLNQTQPWWRLAMANKKPGVDWVSWLFNSDPCAMTILYSINNSESTILSTMGWIIILNDNGLNLRHLRIEGGS